MQTDFHILDFCTSDSSYRINLLNAKTTAQNVLVVEPFDANWSILQESYPHAKSSATSASWNVRIPADGHATLTYEARVSWCGN
jgi:hypothetical protein